MLYVFVPSGDNIYNFEITEHFIKVIFPFKSAENGAKNENGTKVGTKKDADGTKPDTKNGAKTENGTKPDTKNGAKNENGTKVGTKNSKNGTKVGTKNSKSGTKNGTKNGTKKTKNGTNKNNNKDKDATNIQRIFDKLTSDPAITIQRLSEELKLSKRTINRCIKKLKDESIIVREGSNRKGYWLITSDKKTIM